MGDTWWWGHGRYPRHMRWIQRVCRFCATSLDWHKNSDLGSEASIGTGLNSTTRRLIESMALLTKSIGIITPLMLSIVVVVAWRLILYKKDSQIVLYMGEVCRSYHTWASVKGVKKRKWKRAVWCICVVGEVQSNITHVPNIRSVQEKCSMYHASLMNSTGTGSWPGSL